MASVIQPSRTTTSLELELDDLTSNRHSRPFSTANLDIDSSSWLSEAPPDAEDDSSRRESMREFPTELPPVDGGIRAWSFLAASYVLEVLVWGVPLANGVFLEYYEREVFKNTPSTLLPLIGSLASGLNYLLAFPTMSWFTAYPTHRRPAMYIGLVLCIAGLLGASFSSTPMQLLMTQGFLLSVGGSVLYWSASTYLWDWFDKKRGLAVGILFSGTGFGGFVIPLLIDALLRRYGHRTTLRAMAVTFAVLVVAVGPFIKGRIPDAVVKTNRKLTVKFMRKRVFWFFLVVSFVQGMGNFAPQLYLPTYAASALNLTSFQGTLVLALMNASNGIGYPVFGHFSDKHLNMGIVIASSISILSVFFLWGFSMSYPTLIFFAIFYGFVSPSYGAFWSGFTAIAQGDPSETILVFSIFVATRGAGNLVSGPLASSLLIASTGSSFSGTRGAFGLEDGRWGATIIFTGLCAVVGLFAAASGWIPRGEKEKQMIEERAM